jgi:ankyrin repeat protein
VKLAHFSVKEYLESDRILGTEADQFHLESATGHQTLAQSCLTYLRYYSVSIDKRPNRQDRKRFPMLNYAAESWFYQSALQHSVGNGREASFLQLEKARRDWLLVYDPDAHSFWGRSFRGRGQISPCSALYYASLLGLPVGVSRLLESGPDTGTQGGWYGTALEAASHAGHRETVQLLVDKGADVNARSGPHHGALHAALDGGHTEIVQLLVDMGADINANDGNALYSASKEG